MYHGVMADRSQAKNVFPAVYGILDRFHRAKNDRQCQAMLCKLWRPILWRNMKVANPKVRVNSTELFFGAFPVEDPDEEVEVRDAMQARQFQIMGKLLADDSPDVRVAAITGVFR